MILHKQSICLGIIGLLLCGISTFYIYRTTVRHKIAPSVLLLQGGNINIPKHCTHLGLIGSTPHPTQYLATKLMNPDSLDKLQVEDFIDVDDLKDSLRKVFFACKEHNIDCLVIAYLPIYFAKLKTHFKNQCTSVAQRFFNRIAPQMQQIITELATEQNNTMHIVLHIPSHAHLEKLPVGVTSPGQYTQFLVKQFPKLTWNSTHFRKITIINTKVDDPTQTTDLIKYFQYEYLFDQSVTFAFAELTKKGFHRYKTA